MKRFGLLGRKLSHSLSPQIHSHFGDYSYELIEKEPLALDSLFQGCPYDGFNVTIPYKKAVLKYCDFIEPLAEEIGSVNTIRFKDGKCYGYNTDAYGFECLLNSANITVNGKKTLVLGSGGASVTVCAVLKKLGATVTVISRNGENNYGNIEKHYDADCIVNTTPVGMYPENGESPLSLDGFYRLEAVVDIIYNPLKTELLLQAEARGIKIANGLTMLVRQAKRAAEIFTDEAVSEEKAEAAYRAVKSDFTNIVLVGMPSCGKSTVGSLLALKLGRFFSDTDTVVQCIAERTIPEIIEADGVGTFREIEANAVAITGKRYGIIIATGGGAVLREENRKALRQNGRVIFMERDLEELSTKGRPLSKDLDTLKAMYAERKPIYEAVSDCIIKVGATPEETVQSIMEAIQ